MIHDPEDPFGPPSGSAQAGSGTPPDAKPEAPSSFPADPGIPPTEPSAALVPPPKPPRTALAAPAVPPPPPRPPAHHWRERRVVIGGSFDLVAAVNRVLDTLDDVGDRIAEAAGFRARGG